MGTPKVEDLPHYSWDDYLIWEGHWEVINGVAYAMSPAPNIKHQRINTKIVAYLEQLLAICENCFGVMPIDWKISDDTVVQPDASIVCGSVEGQYLDITPKVIFEILSPSTAKKDRTTKYRLYESNSVDYYCMIDPVTDNVEIFQLDNSKYRKIKEGHAPVVIFDLGECEIKFYFEKIWP